MKGQGVQNKINGSADHEHRACLAMIAGMTGKGSWTQVE